MLQNYIKIAVRNLLRHKYYSIINILGLAVGMMCAIMMLIYVQYELSYDSFHSKADRIYRLTLDMKFAQNRFNSASTSGKFAPMLQQDYPEIERIGRIHASYRFLAEYEEKKMYIEGISYADSTIPMIFDFEFLEGDAATALQKPNSIVINKSTADALFGSGQDVLGKTIKLNETAGDNHNFLITGIIKDLPKNTHFNSKSFISFNSLDQKTSFISDWGSSSDMNTYLLMPEGFDMQEFESRMPEFVKKNAYRPDWEKVNLQYLISFQPLTSIHLYSQHLEGDSFRGDINYVYIFTIVAIFILIIASINYINMATARSMSRAKEIGIRKVVGAYKSQLIQQFMLEASILSIIALFISLSMVELLIPSFSEMINRELKLDFLDYKTIFTLFGIFVIVGLLSGLYPAWVLAGFRPSLVLKGKFNYAKKGVGLRKALIVFQFSTSIAMIIGTIIVYSQLEFMQKTDLGFTKEQVLGIPLSDDLYKKADVLKQKLLQNPQIESVTLSSNQIGQQDNSRSTFRIKGIEEDSMRIQAQFYSIDADYLTTLEMKLLYGKNFEGKNPMDSAKYVLVNESFVKKTGWGNSIGEKIKDYSNEEHYTVIGVVKDFHLRSLHHAVMPTVVFYNKYHNDNVFIRLKTKNMEENIASIRKVYEEMGTKYPFEYVFLDKNFEKMYETDQKRSQLFFAFAFLAIFIASLGLSGLVAFYVEQRTKEIGIRKVLGASISSILQLISKDFIVLVAISSLIACPIAYYLMSNWLQDFVYKIDLTSKWYIFLLVVLASVVITLITVCTQAFRAAMTNPVNVLKNE